MTIYDSSRRESRWPPAIGGGVLLVAPAISCHGRWSGEAARPRPEQAPCLPRCANAELGVGDPQATQEVVHVAQHILNAGDGGVRAHVVALSIKGAAAILNFAELAASLARPATLSPCDVEAAVTAMKPASAFAALPTVSDKNRE